MPDPVIDPKVKDETWHTKLPEDLRADPSLIDFKDETEMVSMPVNVARSYISTKKLVGRDKIPMPKTEEEWNDTYSRLGRPEAASQYNVAPELDKIDPAYHQVLNDSAEWFKETAHATGLSDAQATKLFKAYEERTLKTLSDMNSANEVTMNEAETALRTEYGNNFEGKMVLMNRGLTELDQRVGGGLLDLVKESPQAKQPAFIKALVLVGEMMSEDLGLDKTTGGPSIDSATLEDQINTLRSSNEYLQSNNPGHAVAVQKLAKLLQIKHGKTPVDTLTRQSFIS